MFLGDAGSQSENTGQIDTTRSENPIVNNFEVAPATSPELQAEAYRLRYKVYCEEYGYEDPASHPDGLECDRYDRHSIQSVLIHRQTRIVAGVSRLILPVHKGGEVALPFHEACAINRAKHPFPAATTAEASRLLVSAEFIRHCKSQGRRGTPAANRGPGSGDDGQEFLDLLFGLVASVVQTGLDHNITHLCALMRPSLGRLLRRLGICFEPIGPMVEYHGHRQPCYVSFDTLSKSVGARRPDLWKVAFVPGQLWVSSFQAGVA